MKLYCSIAIALWQLIGSPVYSQTVGNSKHEIVIHKLSSDINSKADDYGAYLAKNGLTIYFVSNRFLQKTHVYMAKRKALDSAWGEAEYCKISGNQHYVGAIAFDNIGRFYFATNRESRDINIWEGFGLDSTPTIRALPSPVKTTEWENHPSVTGDGKTLYFASNRQNPGGLMEMLVDIFVAHRNSDDSWTTPQNLGSQINIGIYNGTPFISPDGRFLFFCSKEKNGIDIYTKLYMSEHLSDENIDWSKPALLPFPINSDKENMFPMITSDGKRILFSSNRDGKNGFDIYEAELPEDIYEKIHPSFTGK